MPTPQADEDRDDFAEPSIVAFALQTLTPGKPFPGMAAGTFVDMHGREITIDRDALRDFIQNTRQLIAQFKERGMPGLPIDARKHDRADAAGWIVGIEDDIGTATDSDGEAVPVLRLLAEWTALGVDLLREKVFANFSPTFDPIKKVIRGGSLTNWPASVDEAGVPLFEAVELAQGVYTLSKNDDHEEATMPEAVKEREPEQERAPADEKESREQNGTQVDLAQVIEALSLDAGEAHEANLEKLTELVQQQVDQQWRTKLAEMERRQKFAELARQVTGGNDEAPRGIPADAGTIEAELMKLTPKQAEYWGGLLQDITRSGLTEFSELGHSKRMKGVRQLPAEYAKALDAGELTVADLSNPVIATDLGDVGDYDLSKWED